MIRHSDISMPPSCQIVFFYICSFFYLPERNEHWGCARLSALVITFHLRLLHTEPKTDNETGPRRGGSLVVVLSQKTGRDWRHTARVYITASVKKLITILCVLRERSISKDGAVYWFKYTYSNTRQWKCILKSRLSDLFPLNVCGWPMPITFIPLVKQVNEQGNGESEGGWNNDKGGMRTASSCPSCFDQAPSLYY